ncbi:MAG: methylenetetrahydrofolate reductase [NAD(P)H] [Peptococcaceae bacterium]|jgi:methylenetetrahydrofolate reductase (NADPH)|nr:methylenetetrahydrofolate reductase [NAD(P)H] [Peptococcaceae bacterium]
MIRDLFQQKKTVFSLEVFPPKKNSAIDTVYNTLAGLRDIPADFISVTYGAGGSAAQKNKTGEIAGCIMREYHFEPMAHLTCVGSSKEGICQTLDELKALGIQNVLALRGDKNPDITGPMAFNYARDLTAFIKEREPGLHVAGACYPEGHGECDSLEEGISHLREKVAAGAEHLITQLFFDNDCFYAFMDRALAAGISVPIQAGIMPIISKNQIERIVTMCGASLPRRFVSLINRYADAPEALRDAGIAYATEQIIDLLANGARGIHLYTMNNMTTARRINDNIRSIVDSDR